MVLPLVVGAGYDPIWFGIFLIVTVEMAQITPPVGFNLFVIQGLTNTSTCRLRRLPFRFSWPCWSLQASSLPRQAS